GGHRLQQSPGRPTPARFRAPRLSKAGAAGRGSRNPSRVTDMPEVATGQTVNIFTAVPCGQPGSQHQAQRHRRAESGADRQPRTDRADRSLHPHRR
ncbi:hypothetical protein EN813_051415, partial [Mesorhizobium sp. M00.F.Ca.ET.170.01.1.1]